MALTIIVSNRLPITVKKSNGVLEFSKSDGGLASGLASYTKGRRSIWVGWPGIASDNLTKADVKKIIRELKKDKLYPVFLTQKQIDEYYSGYSNSVLWPLFHNLTFDVKDTAKNWDSYQEVNELFAAATIRMSKPNSKIWIHDYQLFLVPEILRKRLQSSITLGFFLHIPFPKYETFKILPQSKKLLKGVLGAGLVGFHTASYCDEFMNTCNQLGIGVAEVNQVSLGNRTVKIADFPIGIDYDKFANAPKSRAVKHEVRKLQQKYRGYKVILTVDRLDPSKGFIERLEAYFEFLSSNPQLHKKVKLVMLTIPSRTDVKAYADLKLRIDQLVAITNDTFGTSEWLPIDFMYTSVPFEKLSALYQIADVAYVVPTKDGMNLVAKEYIASKQKRDGVLILSETAGAAQELTHAVLVNPKHKRSIVQGLTIALTMPKQPMLQNLTAMQSRLSKNTIHTWAKGFMDSMKKSTSPVRHYTKQLTAKRQAALVARFKAAKKRTIFLDYDGTLVTFNTDPSKTPLPSRVYNTVKKLTEDPRNHVIVVSGRSVKEIDRYLKGLKVDKAAEHGAFLFQNGVWKSTISTPPDWKLALQPYLERYAQLTKGAWVEEKNHALVWHYRESSPYKAKKNLTILKHVLKKELAYYGVKGHDGKKVYEIKPPSVNKGAAVKNWLKKSQDFVLIIGDDYTDEDMFKVAPKHADTLRVGFGATVANFRIKDVSSVHTLLDELNRR